MYERETEREKEREREREMAMMVDGDFCQIKSCIINQRAAGRDADEGKKTLTSTGRNKRLG